jgi:formylglycine-generating enzyme required for sulfatase activity
MKSTEQKLRSPLYTAYIIVFVLLFNQLFTACALFGSGSDDHGSFKYTLPRAWTAMETPWGMVLVRSGSFMSGEVDQDIVNKGEPNKRMSISAFHMDETEVTNHEYRKFLNFLGERLKNPPTSTASTDDNAPAAEAPVRDKWDEMLTEEFIKTLIPDPNVWRNDFSNNMADVYLEGYFEREAYDNYPVVGVTWDAANCYAAWQTKKLNEYRKEKGLPAYPNFSLPSAAQWEYAARGGKELAKYPWGGPYIRDHEGKLRANFKAGKGNYSEDGQPYTYTSPVDAFPPNDFGLYDMAGNVAEWTLDAYNPAAVSRTWDLDPLYLDDEQPMKIIKGGSWKDISRFLQTGAIDYEHKDTPRSYIGFRCILPYIGPQE